MNSWNNQSNTGTKLKVLMQNRPTAFTHRGGDTVLMERFAEELQKLGCEVTLDAGGQVDPRAFDIVHLFNFALPDFTRQLAERAKQAGKPFVVTTLYEEISNFHNQSVTVADSLIEYVKRNQDKNWWSKNRVDIRKVQACSNFQNSWTAANAAMLFSSGERESAALRADYPTARITEIKFGHELGSAADPELFTKKYGVSDFVLCVGRIESRKNQLMLLKALEDSEITVVLAGGGFTYQPAYAQAVRDFRRKGRTIILDRVAPEILASAYAAAKVHCLPSWFELPGLVTLEAAYAGCNVVATEGGTICDYLGDKAFYCDPSSENSIRNAVTAAFYSPVPNGLREAAQSFNWTETGRRTLEAYRAIVPAQSAATPTMSQNTAPGMLQPAWMTPTATVPNVPQTVQSTPVSGANPNADALLERGEEAARNKQFAEAEKILREVEALNPRSVRALKSLGAVRLAQSDVTAAKDYFARALQIEANEPRCLSGMGMCLMMEKKATEAYGYFTKALQISPDHLVTLLQLIEASYTIGRFDDLERVLRDYVAKNPADMEMTYCHAGSLFKLGRVDEAWSLNEKVLAYNPTHLGGKTLRDLINEARSKGASSTLASPASSVTDQSSLKSAISVETTKPVQQSAAPDYIDRKLQELEDAKREKNYDKVRKGCEEVLARSVLRADQREKATILSAEICVLSADLAAAAALYDKVLSANPDCARAMCGKGALAANSGDWQAAQVWFERALSQHSNYDVALAGLGMCATFKNDAEQAWRYYGQALQSNPENQRALLGYIELGYQFGRFSEVERVIKEYLEMHPVDLNFMYSLAGCYYAQGKADEALGEISRITLFEPQHQKALELREMISSGKSSGSVAAM